MPNSSSTVVEHAERAHAKLSASGSARWLSCPASIRMEQDLPEGESSEAAREGTAAHELADWCLTNGKDTKHYKETEIDGFTVAGEMAEKVQEYVDYCRNLPGEHFTEQRVDFSEWVEDGFGTSDFIAIDGTTCNVVDLKYGKGVRVFAEENSQAKLYGLGVLFKYGFIFDEIETFVLTIHQPRLDHIDEWEISKDELLAWAEYVRVRAALCNDEDAPFGASEKACQWCPVSDTCKARAEWALSIAISEFDEITDDLELIDVDHLTNEEIAVLLPQVKGLVAWANSLQGTALAALERGEDIDGHKLVAGRSSRKWKDADDAEKALRKTKMKVSEILIKTMVTPAQAEKIIGKKHSVMTDHVNKIAGKDTIAPLSDKREAIQVSFKDDFADIESVDTIETDDLF